LGEDPINIYAEEFKGQFSKEYLRKQFDFFPDAIGKFIFPCFTNINYYVEKVLPDDGELEDWQRQKFKVYIDKQIRKMNIKLTDYMFHILVLKTFLNHLEISDE